MTNRRNILRNFVGMLVAGMGSLFAKAKIDEKLYSIPSKDDFVTVSLMGNNKKYNWSAADMFMPVEGVIINSYGTIHAMVIRK